MIVHCCHFGAVVLHNKIWIMVGPQQSYQCIHPSNLFIFIPSIQTKNDVP